MSWAGRVQLAAAARQQERGLAGARPGALCGMTRQLQRGAIEPQAARGRCRSMRVYSGLNARETIGMGARLTWKLACGEAVQAVLSSRRTQQEHVALSTRPAARLVTWWTRARTPARVQRPLTGQHGW